jgi:hypothetical protein
MGKDMEYSHYNLTDWKTGARRVPGIGHHKWFFKEEKKIIQIIPKNYPLLYTSKFQVNRWLSDEEFQFYWKGSIKYKEIKDLDFRELIKIYSKFIKENSKLIKKGINLIYIDNPYFLFKEHLKLLLRR